MSHITKAQRYTISSMLKRGKSQKEISETIGKHKSVVSREIKRNKDARSGEYRDDLAQRKYESRKKKIPKHIRFTEQMKVEVEELLKKDHSPEQVCGYMKKEGKDCVSLERIYQHIWLDKKQGGILYNHLRTQGKRYRKRGAAKDSRGIIKNRIGIENRPSVVDEKNRFGDIEVDLVIGKNHKEALVTANDRASGMLKMKHIKSKEAQVVADALCEILEEWKSNLHTITSDNGKEFALHEHIAKKLEIDFFFAKPYHSWQRGANENLNGLVRQYFPKKSDFSTITDQKVEEVAFKINSRPRKRYLFENPIFVMNELLVNPKVAFVT